MNMHNPPHPGEFNRQVYLEPHQLSVRSLAESLDVSASTIARIVNGQRGLSITRLTMIATHLKDVSKTELQRRVGDTYKITLSPANPA